MANSEEKLSENVQKLLYRWSPPKVSVHDVYYRRGLFEFRPSWKINKVTKTVAIQGEYQQLQLLKKQDIWDHMQKKYNNLHIGLVQVAIKPLTRKGLNCSVLVCLRDCRMAKFGDSLLAVADSSLSDGPIYFDYYPNYPISLAVSNTNILDTLTLNIRTQGLMNADGGPGPGDVALVYVVYYKVMAGERARPKEESPSGQTTFVETNLLRDDKLPILETVRWGSIQYPKRWVTGETTGGNASEAN